MKRLLVFFVVLLFVAPVQAKNEKHKAKDAPVPSVHEAAEKPLGFLPPPPPPLPGMSRESQQEVIDRYYRKVQQERNQYYHPEDGALKDGKKKKQLPPGLMKKKARGKELPPGWQKKIARGEVLDHDVRDHCRELPSDLYRELPPPPKGTKFLQLEDKIIRVVEATFEIVDVFTFGR